MSFLTKITVDEKELDVLHCDFLISKITDATGKPTSEPQGGTIHLLLQSNDSPSFFDWMISLTQTKDGEITFYRYNKMSILKTLQFKEAYCIGYHEIFDPSGKYPMQIQLALSARELKFNNSEVFKKNWPDKVI